MGGRARLGVPSGRAAGDDRAGAGSAGRTASRDLLTAVAIHLRLQPDARRAQLLEVGFRLFTERPYDDFSMDDVAAEAGVSKGLLYHYFPSKRQLYTAALKKAAASMLAATEPEPGQPPDVQLRRALGAYLDYVREHAPAYRAVLRGGIGTDPEVAAIAEDFRRTVLDRLRQGLSLDPADPRLRTALRGWIGLVEAASLDWIEHGELARDELLGVLTGALGDLLRRVRPERGPTLT
ncbi:MAG: TetR/AcrR family transcriptional regulator [Chloroflexi bacterium]|nr:MAG: TetR/AcrR family transcriptional regulator [Chloroflexota bacterium]